MPGFYTDQTTIDQAALIVSLIGRKAMTLSQINTLLTANSADVVTDKYLSTATKNAWLLTQPYGLYQVNPKMDIMNGNNRLISSLVPTIVESTWHNEQPSSYVGGMGITYSKALQQNTSTGAITLYGQVVHPRIPVVNDALILAPNPRVI